MPTPPRSERERREGALLIARVITILYSPRTTFEALALAPRVLGVVTLSFLVTTGCAAIVLETDVGQLALLDRWDRTASTLGRTVDDVQYRAMEDASRHGAAYAALMAAVTGPVLTVGLSGLLFAVFRAGRVAARPDQPALGGRSAFADRPNTVTYKHMLAVVGHAGVILALRQVIGAPLTYMRETLAGPMTMRVFFTMLDEASFAARFLSTIDLFVVWWIIVLAIGMSVLYRRPALRLACLFVGAYVTLSAVVAIVVAAVGGTA